MAIQTIPGGLVIPHFPSEPNGAPVLNGNDLDAVSEKIGVTCQAPKTGSIRKIGFCSETVTGGTWVFDARLETVNTGDYKPSGTLWNSPTNTTNANLTVLATDDNKMMMSDAFTADASVTIGDRIALVFNVTTDPGGLLGYSRFTQTGTDWSHGSTSWVDTGAGWAVQGANRQIGAAVEYSDGTYEPIADIWPMASITNTTFNSTDTISRRGLYFQLPFPAQIRGCCAWLDGDGDYDVVLYDSDGSTELMRITVDKDHRTDTGPSPTWVTFDALVSLSKTTNYRLVIEPDTTDIITYDFSVGSDAAVMDTWPGGQEFHLTTYDTGWSQTTTSRPFISLVLDGFDDATGGGGGGGTGNPFIKPVV